MEITQSEQQTKKSNEKNESKIRDIWETIKCANLHTIGIPERKESKKEILAASKNDLKQTWQTVNNYYISRLATCMLVTLFSYCFL